MPFIAPDTDKKKPPAAPAAEAASKAPAKGFIAPASDRPKTVIQQEPMVPRDQWQSGLKATLGVAPKPEPTAAGVVDAATRGVSPYAIAAGIGGGIGAVAGAPAGGVGALPGYAIGAGLGVTGLALTDAASGIWNSTAVPLFGAPRTMGGSEMILAGTDTLGLTKPVADDPNARIANQIASLGAGSIGMGNVINAGGQLLSRVPGAIGAMGNFFARPIAATSAVAGGATGGGVQQGLIEMGADPLVAAGGGVLASMAGGQFGAGAQPRYTTPALSGAQQRAEIKAGYNASKAQGLQWSSGQIDNIATRAVDDVINEIRPPGEAISRGSVPSTITTVLRDMADLARTQGRLDAGDIETFRQRLGGVVGGLSNEANERTAGRLILQKFDELTSQADTTINALRGNVASARTAAQQAEAAATAARGTPQEAAARTAADAARVRYEQRQAAMYAQDPDMAPVVQARDQATGRAQIAETRSMDADANYNRMATEQIQLEEAAIAAENAYEAAVIKYAATPNAPPVNKARAAFRKATDVATANAPNVDRAQAAADRARNVLDRTQRARDAANRTVQDRENSLATVDDAAQRMSERNRLLTEAREKVPTRARTEAFEAIPEAARTATGASGQQARALREQVRAFIRSSGGREFAQLPEETRRQLQRFVSGGGMTQRVMDMFGHLAPGFHDRNLAANILSGINAAATGGLVGPAVQAGVGMATRSVGNAMARSQFNQLRDMVARGDAVLPRQPGQAGNRAVNYMLNTATQPDIRQ